MEEFQFQCSPEQAKDADFITITLKSLLNLNSDEKIYYKWHKRTFWNLVEVEIT